MINSIHWSENNFTFKQNTESWENQMRFKIEPSSKKWAISSTWSLGPPAFHPAIQVFLAGLQYPKVCKGEWVFQLLRIKCSHHKCKAPKQMLLKGPSLSCDYYTVRKQNYRCTCLLCPDSSILHFAFLPFSNKWKPNESLTINKLSN